MSFRSSRNSAILYDWERSVRHRSEELELQISKAIEHLKQALAETDAYRLRAAVELVVEELSNGEGGNREKLKD